MMLLKIKDNKGFYRIKDKEDFKTLDLLTANDMLEMFKRLFKVNQKEYSLNDCIEEYNEEKIANEAHKIIYEKLYSKLKELWNNKDAIIEEVNSDFEHIEKEYLQ